MKWLCALLLAGCESVFPLDSPPPAWRLLGFGQVESVDTLPLGTPTSAHSLVVVAVQTDGFIRVTEVTDNAGNVYQQAPAAEVTRTTDTSMTTVSVWFAADPAPGATNVTTSAGLFAEGMVGWQVEFDDPSTPAFDNASRINDVADSIDLVGPPVNTSSAGAFVISIAVAGEVFETKPDTEFTLDATVQTNGWGHLTSPAAGSGEHHSEWTQRSAVPYSITTVSFLPGA